MTKTTDDGQHGHSTTDPDVNPGADQDPIENVDEPTGAAPPTPPTNDTRSDLGGGTGQRSFTLAPHPGLLNDAEIDQFVAAIQQMVARARQAKREDQGKPETPQDTPQDDAQAERD